MTIKHGSTDSGSEVNDDAFDDGDDLMARAADMMDFDDDDEEDSDAASQEDSEMREEELVDPDGDEAAHQQQPARKKQKASNGTAHPVDESEPEGDELLTSSMLHLQVRSRLFSFPGG